MADKHGLNYEVRELKLGASFTNNKASQYHTIKYDFKPASVDVNKMATVDVGTNNQVTVTVPHLDGAGVPHTVFKGSQRPYTKECVLIIDRVTGEITLEKLSSNIQVKKTRQESASKPRPLTPVTADFTNTTQRSTSRTRVATTRRAPPPLPAPASGSQSSGQARYGSGAVQKTPPNMVRSPPRVKTSPPQAPWSSGGNSTLASLPMIGFDDAPAPAPAPAPPTPVKRDEKPERIPPPERMPERMPERRPERMPERIPERLPERIPEIREPAPPMPSLNALQQSSSSVIGGGASSSSSSSDSDSGSDSDSNSDDDAPARQVQQALTNGSGAALPTDVLNDDLCLSESGSDSD